MALDVEKKVQELEGSIVLLEKAIAELTKKIDDQECKLIYHEMHHLRKRNK